MRCLDASMTDGAKPYALYSAKGNRWSDGDKRELFTRALGAVNINAGTQLLTGSKGALSHKRAHSTSTKSFKSISILCCQCALH